MTLQSSGVIDLSDVQTEHGGTNPIKMSEYYLGGGIDQFQQETVTAASLNVTSQEGFQDGPGPASLYYPPQINTNNTVYRHYWWADNGSGGDIDCTFTVNKTGTYWFRLAHYCDCSHSGRAVTYLIQKNGATLISATVGTGSYSYKDYQKAVTAGDTIRVKATWPSSGWSGSNVLIGGDSYKTRTLTTPGNTGLPTSGTIRMSDFYGTTNY